MTIDEIVHAAGVAKGTFYTHFADRDDLERAVTQRIRAVVERSIVTTNADVRDTACRIARAMCVYFRFAIDEREGAAVLARMHGDADVLASPLNRGLVEDVRVGIRSGRLTAATVESGALFVIGVTQIGLLRALDQPSVRSAATVAKHMCELVLRGFGLANSEAETLAAQAAGYCIRQSKKAEKLL